MFRGNCNSILFWNWVCIGGYLAFIHWILWAF